MKCENKELIKKSVHLFEAKKDLETLFVTDDGQFFYTEKASAYHCQLNDLRVYEISRDMALGKSKQAPKVEDKKVESKPDAKKTIPKTKKSVKDG